MKEINLASVLVAKRREKGITQDELAAYIGVSKASVSKWETGQSYPDITFLPLLAAYFNISIDELMSYSPQMERSDIAKLYTRLAADFASRPFEDVIAECAALIKKYYSCFPLLVQLVKLYTNHFMLAGTQERQEALLNETVTLCERIQAESGDVQLAKEAVSYQALCSLALQRPQQVLDLLGEGIRPMLPEGMLIAQAYQVMGNIGKAKETLQTELYQYVMVAFQGLLNVLQMATDHFEKAEEAFLRASDLAQIFNMKQLNPNNVILLYALGARMYCANNSHAKAIELLGNYVDTCVGGFFPFELHGDAFFDLIDPWLKDCGAAAPRSEQVIKESMLRDVLMNPAFASLQDDPGYRRLVQKMERFIGR
ncbi:transcriptional regulator, XRE family [Desulfitobacterium hafniense DCB-2]|uniref:Transcriptional regulator, XRE family n=1 Tax=Desulfitobacterium hafniense (strain DSM 10664 / DCB-2) TaxID=272564 RepID=B8FPE3_DESHD|nr:helix-turn-helix transcriptional regulator [Desulfitobacterium hafniense]ACL19668.1 transcriptional regulator, XRE family [Desulfitobacterium hafniense DCB-2]